MVSNRDHPFRVGLLTSSLVSIILALRYLFTTSAIGPCMRSSMPQRMLNLDWASQSGSDPAKSTWNPDSVCFAWSMARSCNQQIPTTIHTGIHLNSGGRLLKYVKLGLQYHFMLPPESITIANKSLNFTGHAGIRTGRFHSRAISRCHLRTGLADAKVFRFKATPGRKALRPGVTPLAGSRSTFQAALEDCNVIALNQHLLPILNTHRIIQLRNNAA
jgi:hypothetical protein